MRLVLPLHGSLPEQLGAELTKRRHVNHLPPSRKQSPESRGRSRNAGEQSCFTEDELGSEQCRGPCRGLTSQLVGAGQGPQDPRYRAGSRSRAPPHPCLSCLESLGTHL